MTGRGSASGAAPRTILHVDMDAFFASVELLRHPELRGRPVVVGGSGARGVVAAASYEARSYGVHSAMPSVRARRLCPDAVFLPGDHAHYAEVSSRVMAIFRSHTPLVEPLSLDEAFLDVTGARRLSGDGRAIASTIRHQVRDQEGLTCSVGVAPVKFLAKLATSSAKPRPSRRGPVFGPGVFVVAPGEEIAFLHPLPIAAMWGVGPATQKRLDRYGVKTVGDIAALPRNTLEKSLGRAHGGHLHDLAHGRDDRDVVPDHEVKSISHEETYPADVYEVDRLRREAVRMGDAVAARLREGDLEARTVTIKVRFADFRTITRSRTPDDPVASGPDVARIAKELLEEVDVGLGIRLLGVGVANLVKPGEGPPKQLSLLDEIDASAGEVLSDQASGTSRRASASTWHAATAAIDQARARFGDDAVVPATLVEGGGARVRRTGDHQWGPDEVHPEG